MAQNTTMQAVLQQILAKLDGLERTAVSQGQALGAVQDAVRAVQQELQAVKADIRAAKVDVHQEVQAVKADVKQEVQAVKADVKQEVQAVKADAQHRGDAMQQELQDVVLFAREKRARVSEQTAKQRLFMDALYVVANVGYDKEVRAVFSLNSDTWTDFRLWSVIINRKIKHTRIERYKNGDDDNSEDEDEDDEEEEEEEVEYEYEETRLIHQVRVGRESSVLRLQRLGANVHMTDKDGKTALSHASKAGRKGLVKALLAAGSKVDHADNQGDSSLVLASRKGYDECVKLLIEAKADVNHASKNGWTSLMLASGGGHPECVKLLLAAKANVDDVNKCVGRSALSWACENDESGPRTEVIKLLIEAQADVNQSDEYGRTALMKACDHGNEATVRLLIEANANIDGASKSGETALMCAIRHPRIVKLLIEAKADVNRASVNGFTALMCACECVSEGCLATVKLLLAVPGIDIDHVGNLGKTALSLAKAPKRFWESEDFYPRRLSLVPLLEDKMRQQAIDNEVAVAVKSIDAAANNNYEQHKKGVVNLMRL